LPITTCTRGCASDGYHDGLQGIGECMRVVRIDDSIFANGFD
jgi:hypothetical protein